MATTSGLVSAYQTVEYSAQIVVRHNLASTGAEEFAAEIVTLPDALSLRDTELVKVKVSPRYEALAIAILSRRALLKALPDSILIIARSALRILGEAGIPYEVIEWVPRYEFHLPKTFNDGSPIPDDLFTAVREELVSRFGGFNMSQPGSLAEGWWKSGSVLYRDDILIYQVSTKEDEDEFFQQYRKVLEERFKQEEIWMERLEARRI